MQWFDELSSCRHTFVFCQRLWLILWLFGKSKQIKPEEKCEAKCELSFPWNCEMIFFPLPHLYFTVSLPNYLVLQCPFLFALNSTQTSDTKHTPVPSSVPCLFFPCHLSHSLSLSLHRRHARLSRTQKQQQGCPISIQRSVCTFVFVCPSKHLLKHMREPNSESDDMCPLYASSHSAAANLGGLMS